MRASRAAAAFADLAESQRELRDTWARLRDVTIPVPPESAWDDETEEDMYEVPESELPLWAEAIAGGVVIVGLMFAAWILLYLMFGGV